MITAEALMLGLNACGVSVVTGVPCSFLTPVINCAISDDAVAYRAATQEGEAVAIGAGAWLAGGMGCVISQNSGLGNMVNPLTSLTYPCRIPVLLVVTWRGQPGIEDEPQHELMGRVTRPLLELVGVPSRVLPSDPARLEAVLSAAWRAMSGQSLPYAVIVEHDTVAPEPLREPPPAPRLKSVVHRHEPLHDRAPRRVEALERLLQALPDHAAVISTTGKTSRELYTLADRAQHFYVVGAMGSAAAVGLGVALQTTQPVVVVDGDGAALMHMGTLATIGAHAPANLVHVLLDNGVHDSTGGQRTLSAAVDLPAVAAACGYRQVHDCGDSADLAPVLQLALTEPGPTFIYQRIQPGSLPNLGRPTIHPAEMARRFRTFVTGRQPALATGGRA
jgi:phosphonopyruvate decarboxylase